MALITCPECGRQNVSDNAAACPDCGYPIKEHFDRIKVEEEKKKKKEEEKAKRKENERIKKLEEERKKAEEEIRRKETEQERKEKAIKDVSDKIDLYKTHVIFFIVFLFIWVVMQIVWGISPGGIIICAITIFLIVRAKRKMDNAKNELQLVQSDIEQYEKIVEAERKKVEAIQKKKEQERERQERIKEAQHPVCPNCGSKNTHRISTSSRAVSTAAWGAASSTIGKQYKCDDCKHMW